MDLEYLHSSTDTCVCILYNVLSASYDLIIPASCSWAYGLFEQSPTEKYDQLRILKLDMEPKLQWVYMLVFYHHFILYWEINLPVWKLMVLFYVYVLLDHLMPLPTGYPQRCSPICTILLTAESHATNLNQVIVGGSCAFWILGSCHLYKLMVPFGCCGFILEAVLPISFIASWLSAEKGVRGEYVSYFNRHSEKANSSASSQIWKVPSPFVQIMDAVVSDLLLWLGKRSDDI